MLTYDELLNNYKTLIELVADLKAEKEVYIEAKREVYEHPQSLPKNFARYRKVYLEGQRNGINQKLTTNSGYLMAIINQTC